jgi:hypothetical protein
MAATLGITALASFLLPGPTSIVTSAAAGPLQTEDLPAATVSSERAVAESGPVVPKEAPLGVSVAAGDSVHLAAWVDVNGTVKVARVSAAGTLLDPLGISLRSHGEAYVTNPDVAFDGTNFLVAWRAEGSILAKRVSPEGEVLDESNIVVSTAASNPKISFDGDNYLLVWIDQKAGAPSYDIFGRRVSPDGEVVDASDLTISADPSDQFSFSLAFNGSQHLLAWTRGSSPGSDVYGTIVDKDGVAANPAGVPIATGTGDQDGPVVTAVGASFFVAWTDYRGVTYDVYGSRVSPAGVPLDPTAIPIAVGPGTERLPAVASDGTGVLATWDDQTVNPDVVRYTRIDAAGAILDPSRPPVPVHGFSDISFDGTNYLVAASTAARVSPGGAVLDPDGILVSTAGNAQRDLDMAFDGTNQFVVWVDDRYPGTRIYGGRQGPDGELLDGSGIAISAGVDVPASATVHHETPSVAFDGTNYLVVWKEWNYGEGNRIRAARVSADGAVLDRFDVKFTEHRLVNAPDVAFGGGVFLVAWDENDAIPGSEVRATRVSTDGALLEPQAVLVSQDQSVGFSRDVAIAYGGSDFLVAWEAGSTSAGSFDILGTLVSPSGAVATPGGVAIGTPPTPTNETDPDVAWHDGTYLVVWRDERTSPDNQRYWPGDIYGARVDASGTVLDADGIPISTDPAGQDSPRVAANGRFFVIWSDGRYGTASDILGTRVESDGTVASPAGQVVTNGTASETGAVVAPARGSGQFAVAYTRYNPKYDTDRGYVRHVAPK